MCRVRAAGLVRTTEDRLLHEGANFGGALRATSDPRGSNPNNFGLITARSRRPLARRPVPHFVPVMIPPGNVVVIDRLPAELVSFGLDSAAPQSDSGVVARPLRARA